MAPRVSIVVPCLLTSASQAALLDETLRTVDAQTVDDYEVIVVDDGSPAPVAPVVVGHRHARVVRQANAGPAIARNTGIAASRGDALVFLDADDHLLPRAIEIGLRELAADPACGFCVGAREEMTFEGGPVPWEVARTPVGAGSIYRALLAFEWYIMPPSTAMFRRGVVDAVGGFRDPWGADDLDFYLRAARAADARCHAAPVTRYRRYAASSSRDGVRMLDSARAVYERQWPMVQDDPVLREAWTRGLAALTEIFRDCLIENVEDRLRSGDLAGAARAGRRLAAESPERWEVLRARLPAAAALQT